MVRLWAGEGRRGGGIGHGWPAAVQSAQMEETPWSTRVRLLEATAMRPGGVGDDVLNSQIRGVAIRFGVLLTWSGIECGGLGA